jgi:hypothetical protein
MLNQSRQIHRRLRLWLIAAAAILLFTSILEASHVHGIFTSVDDDCILCQHSVALDKLFSSPTIIALALVITAVVFSLVIQFVPSTQYRFSCIRAPPSHFHFS